MQDNISNLIILGGGKLLGKEDCHLVKKLIAGLGFLFLVSKFLFGQLHINA